MSLLPAGCSGGSQNITADKPPEVHQTQQTQPSSQPDQQQATSQPQTQQPTQQTPQQAQSPVQLITATVTRVVDGDTAHVNIAGKDETVRFIGVDTPETVHPTRYS